MIMNQQLYEEIADVAKMHEVRKKGTSAVCSGVRMMIAQTRPATPVLVQPNWLNWSKAVPNAGTKRTRRYIGAMASESEYGRLLSDTWYSNSDSPESRFDRVLVLMRLELLIDVEVLADARINGWTTVCEVTEAREWWDIQACVHEGGGGRSESCITAVGSCTKITDRDDALSYSLVRATRRPAPTHRAQSFPQICHDRLSGTKF